MKAIDTNVVIRIITEDDPDQTQTARRLLSEGVFISHSVLLEAEWVLRSFYRWTRGDIADALADLVDLGGVHVLHGDLLSWALDRYRSGADWADMFHLLGARGTESFLTFDRRVVPTAGPAAPVRVETLR